MVQAAFNASTRSPSAAPASMASWVSRPASSSSRTTSPSFPFPNRSRASSHDPPPSACAPAWAATFPSSTWTAMAAAPRQLFEESTNPPQTRKKKDSYRCGSFLGVVLRDLVLCSSRSRPIVARL
ncbi:hypothetical protein ACCO45_008397 [Purpureocillium lilacinum]|uniref:Uncharacterized protein n=1 Tax=Purpureocillium lilacinum TaxID=33203 RepID=A0ACC4DPK9_PURLI